MQVEDRTGSAKFQYLRLAETGKRGLKGPENEAIENSRHIFGKTRYPFSWKNKGAWKLLAPRKHPGWAAYHANKDKE